jgi:hypothetical protein
VTVITNSRLVEPGFRTLDSFSVLSPDDIRPQEVIDIADRPCPAYLPFAEPMLSALTGAILTKIKQSAPDVIVASYLEPYGMAALLAQEQHAIPTFLRHAGSDVGSLALHPYLGEFYAAYAPRSSGILTYADDDGNRDLLSIGFHESQIIRMNAIAQFPSQKSEEALGLEELRSYAKPHFEGYLSEEATGHLVDINASAFSSLDGPVIGIYGKAGQFKGTFELLDALADCASSGCQFRFCMTLSGWRPVIEEVLAKIASSELRNRAALLPPLHPNDVPAFLAACNWVAFLENNFPIAAHTPRVPFEIISAGKLLIITEEQVRKSQLAPPLQHMVNAVIIPDPFGRDGIARCLSRLLADPATRSAVESRALLLRKLLNLAGARWNPGDNDMLAAIQNRLSAFVPA